MIGDEGVSPPLYVKGPPHFGSTSEARGKEFLTPLGYVGCITPYNSLLGDAMNTRKSLEHGFTVASSTNPTGDNYVANFARGIAVYYAPELRAKRAAVISDYVNAFKAAKLAS